MGIHEEILCYEDLMKQPLENLVSYVAKEAGEMIASVYIDKDDHWKNELGDLCGLVIPALLKRAGMSFTEAKKLGIERFEEKMKYKRAGLKAPTHKEKC